MREEARKIFRKVVKLDEAVKIVESFCMLKEEFERIPILLAHSRVLAEDVYAKIDVPPFDRAAMDGYALKAEDTFGADEERPVKMKIVGKIEAGEIPDFEIKSGEAAEISTGAAIPKGANAVVMVE
ncbi:MAG: molybdopterin biosynthesis protein, partial [Archaeoglobales archaeon]|nr:molybdopterin biosynthesis protein [Archaeoglobales archaeon]